MRWQKMIGGNSGRKICVIGADLSSKNPNLCALSHLTNNLRVPNEEKHKGFRHSSSGFYRFFPQRQDGCW